MTIPHLSETLIRQYCTAQSYERGRDYYLTGAVLSVTRRGEQIQAEVSGSDYLPYRVAITFDEGNISDATCTCPYDWGGWCKHIVATLLTCLHQPDQMEERPPAGALLADLSREQLQTVLLRLVEQQPGLADLLETEVQRLQALSVEPHKPKTLSQRKALVDAAAFRRRVRAILRSLDGMRPSEAYWHVSGVVDQVRQVLAQAWDFIEAGDGENAIRILEAITEEYMEDWMALDDSDGEVGSFFIELGEAWTEALLTADLPPDECQTWAGRLTRWQDEIDDYGIEDAFSAAQAAALQGWDYPPLRRVLEGGEITPLGDWEGEASWYADDLAQARLNVLARQKRYQEYLRLAEAEGQMQQYLTMLAQLGRIQEAVEQGMQYLTTEEDALALARALHAQGAVEEALRIAEHGLQLEVRTAALARWLRDAAREAGQDERALQAAIAAFRQESSLRDYLAVQELAGDRWPEIRTDLLEYLRRERSYYSESRVEVFLHEGLIDDAIAVVDDTTAYYSVVEQVVDAAIEKRPDWAIRTARQQAESIMDEGKAKYYHHAVRWLEKARAAYRAAGREAEWNEYLDGLLRRHARKYKLVPMLKALG